ncbi:MAG: site-specific integrase [Oscillospiraceae bacterium]|nr:site-specific integrase [Oscillospiraceae bacterium]
MSVYKNAKTGKWYCIFRVTDWTGKRKQIKKAGFSRRTDALEYERNYTAKESGSLDMTFGTLVDLYMADAKARLRPTTYENKTWIMDKKILPYFRDQYVTDITPAKIRKWQTELIKKGYAPTYLKTINNQLTAVFNYAVKYYNLPQSPTAVAGSMGKRSAGEMDFWTLEEFEQFIAGLDGDPTASMAFNLLFWTGMREGELLALTLNDCDFKRQGIYIRHNYARLHQDDLIQDPKTEKGKRFIPCPAFLMKMIQEYSARLYEYAPDDRLFPYTKSWINDQMKRGCKRTGVRKIRVHDVRHSHASMLIESGADPLLLADRMGHEKVTTTLEIYSHLYPDKGQALAATLDALKARRDHAAASSVLVDDPPTPEPDF